MVHCCKSFTLILDSEFVSQLYDQSLSSRSEILHPDGNIKSSSPKNKNQTLETVPGQNSTIFRDSLEDTHIETLKRSLEADYGKSFQGTAFNEAEKRVQYGKELNEGRKRK